MCAFGVRHAFVPTKHSKILSDDRKRRNTKNFISFDAIQYTREAYTHEKWNEKMTIGVWVCVSVLWWRDQPHRSQGNARPYTVYVWVWIEFFAFCLWFAFFRLLFFDSPATAQCTLHMGYGQRTRSGICRCLFHCVPSIHIHSYLIFSRLNDIIVIYTHSRRFCSWLCGYEDSGGGGGRNKNNE